MILVKVKSHYYFDHVNARSTESMIVPPPCVFYHTEVIA